MMFGEWRGEEPRGWCEVEGLEAQGGVGGNGVRLRVLQVRVCENHQNGKDTHVRGVQVFARDERSGGGAAAAAAAADGGGEEEMVALGREERRRRSGEWVAVTVVEPGWMEEPGVR